MIRPLIHDPIFLAGKSEKADASDLPLARDLLETLKANSETCVGMAANMIGVKKRIIAFVDDSGGKAKHTVLLNPEIVKADGEYQTHESCLSLLGGPRPCTRYRLISVSYEDMTLKKRVKTYAGWTAQIIQHEIDHCNGVLI